MASQEGDIAPQPALPLHLPPGDVAVEVSIVDTTTKIVCPASGFVKPVIPGHEHINMPTAAFHIKHPSGKEVMFDLGSRKDWWNFSPVTLAAVKSMIPGLNVAKGIDEVLVEGGVKLENISSIIWSHWHWDHTGDPSLFPPTAELIVGPGFKAHFTPGFPSNPSSVMLDSDFAGRHVREISFTPSFKIGAFDAHDFFADGSLYILNVPGHAIGHISALARTTANPASFVFMGGDVCHFGGSFRPTPYAPMPSTIPASAPLDYATRFRRYAGVGCPCSVFTACHPDAEHARTKPYYEVTREADSWYVDPPMAQASIEALEAFDASPDVFVAIAHDEGLGAVCEWFPQGTMTEWKKKGWKERARWGFLNALPIEGEKAHEDFAPGLMREGVWVQDLDSVKPREK